MLLWLMNVIAIWTALSIPCGIAFCWLLKTKRISFEPIEDRNEFSRNWERRS